MLKLYSDISRKVSKKITHDYSTSFTLGIKLLHKNIQDQIYSIYGFVRIADEIVDTFHDAPQEKMLDEFKRDTFLAIERGISTNLVLNAFQEVVNNYNIDHKLINQFFHSMYMDLEKQDFTKQLYDEYIVGSAEAVGLMCLFVFLDGDREKYDKLEDSARRLGAVFQKVNFLRDAQYDFNTLGRVYFPNLDFENISKDDLQEIYSDIDADFEAALVGIKQLSINSRFGVYLAYKYYRQLFNKIRRKSSNRIMEERIRIPNPIKYIVLMKTYIRYRLNIL